MVGHKKSEMCYNSWNLSNAVVNETLYCMLGIPHALLGAYALPTIMLRYEHSWSLPVFKCLPHILLHR